MDKFRKKLIYRVIIPVSLILTIFGLSKDVHAATLTYDWYKEVIFPQQATIADCGSSACQDSTTIVGSYDMTDETEVKYYSGAQSTYASYGGSINFVPQNPLIANYLYSITTYQCFVHPNNSYAVPFKQINLYSASSYANLLNKNYDGVYTKFQSLLRIGDIVGYDLPTMTCNSISYFYVPKFDSTYIGLNLTSSETNVTGIIEFYGYKIENLGLYSSAYESIIDEALANSNLATQDDIDALNAQIQNQIKEQQATNDKLDDTNNKLDGIQGSINDDNVDDSTSTGSGFFSDFELNDNGGISGIVKAPLTLINSLLGSSNSCPDLRFEILGKEVSMPGGCMLWDLADDSIVTIYQTFVCGISAYFICTSLFKDIDKLKNPGNSEVSTLDL